MKSILHGLFVVSSVLMLPIPHAVAASYQAIDLAAFAIGTHVTVSGINSAGTLAGTIDRSDGTQQAFTWSTNTGFQYLSPLQGFTGSVANGINDNGQVVGYSIYSGYSVRANLWESGSSAQDLGLLPSGRTYRNSEARGINKDGLIVGYSTSDYGDHAVLWAEDMEDLSGADGLPNTSAHAINDYGSVVGSRGNKGFIWTRTTGMSDIDVTEPNMAINAVDINNAGQVVLQAYSALAGGSAYLWQDGHNVINLGTLSGGPYGDYTSAYGVNNLGQIVGTSSQQAFIWDSVNGIQSLPLLSGHLIGAANSINDSGLIAGYSFDELGRSHLVLWTPVPEPSSLIALMGALICTGKIALLRRRNQDN